MRFGPVLAAVGRFLEGRGTRARSTATARSPRCRRRPARSCAAAWASAARSTSCPTATIATPTSRSRATPTRRSRWSARLVPHKRVDLLLAQLAVAAAASRGCVSTSSATARSGRGCSALAAELGLRATSSPSTASSPTRSATSCCSRAWLTTSTSHAEGWGLSIIEAAAYGVPTRRAATCRACATRWSTAAPAGSSTRSRRLRHGAGPRAARARRRGPGPRGHRGLPGWAGCFTWDRSAELLAGRAARPPARRRSARDGRSARRDIGIVAEFARPRDCAGRSPAALRPTDQVDVHGDRVGLLLTGCDEVDAAAVLRRLGVTDADVRLADRYDLLVGPARLPDRCAPTGGPRRSRCSR